VHARSPRTESISLFQHSSSGPQAARLWSCALLTSATRAAPLRFTPPLYSRPGARAPQHQAVRTLLSPALPRPRRAQVLTFVGETRVLAINAGDELEEDELPGFVADAQARPQPALP